MRAAKRLLDWYDTAHRPLPWRRDRDPYRVWVSEVMLQQTRAESVVPRYQRFLAQFPTVTALAAASRDEVLAAWSGLGYYRRAHQLHRAAQEIERAGTFPSRRDALRALPGVGEYTAAAIASIAFGEAVAVLDGNVERVTARLAAVAGDPKRVAVRTVLRSIASGLVDAERPGDSNQALMELGASLCLPVAPRCASCPLAQDCRGLAEGAPERYPTRRRRAAPRRVPAVAAVVRSRDRRLLLVRRPDGAALLAGTWEVPWVELDLAPRSKAAAERALGRSYGGRWCLGPVSGSIEHAITQRRFEVEVRGATLAGGDVVAEGAEADYFEPVEIRKLPRSALVDKIVGLIGEPCLRNSRRARPRHRDRCLRPTGCASR